MSHLTLAQQGIEATDKKDWATAIPKLTAALKVSLNPVWLICRSKALNGAGQYAESLADADLAWHAALSRNKRELVAEANYRRAVAYNRLGQYANAACCCAYAMRIFKGASPLLAKEDPKEEFIDAEGRCTLKLAEAKAQTAEDEFNKAKKEDTPSLQPASEKVKQWRIASVLQIQALNSMEKLDVDDPARKITASQKPEQAALSDLGEGGKSTSAATSSAPKSAASEPAAVSAPKPAADAKLRLGDYQSDQQITVSIFSKGVDKARLAVEILPFSVNLDPVVYPNGEEKSFTLDLWGEIDPDQSKHTVTPSKVELMLRKKKAGKWPQVIKEKDAGADTQKEPATDKPAPETAPEPEPAAPEPTAAKGKENETTAAPSYPTSSRSGPKNWDKLEAEGGDSDDDSDVNQFFKKIYKGATPEQQRAMMKSFTESNGTSLSTDWDDVKNRTVETNPPAGVEAKKWG